MNRPHTFLAERFAEGILKRKHEAEFLQRLLEKKDAEVLERDTKISSLLEQIAALEAEARENRILFAAENERLQKQIFGLKIAESEGDFFEPLEDAQEVDNMLSASGGAPTQK